MTFIKKQFLAFIFIVILLINGCSNESQSVSILSQNALTTAACEGSDIEDHITTEIAKNDLKDTSLNNLPAYSGEPFITINRNQPFFNKVDFSTTSFETYSDLDSLGRCGVAYANIGTDLMPTGKRESIGQVKPSGWQTIKYDNIDGKYLYNRCHLIGYQLTSENANEKNLITGTRYLNIEGMLPFENIVADYIKETENHVLYRVTPIFQENELVARGLQMEGYSIEDSGEGICYNVFVYNVQPGISIDYSTGKSYLISTDTSSSSQNSTQTSEFKSDEKIRGNSNSKIYHCPGQANYEEMANSKYLVIFKNEQEAVDAGYRKAKR